MPAPTNTTPATAIPLGPLPVSLSVDVSTPPATGALWYRYTAVPGEFSVGVSAVAAPSTTYPLMSVYSDAGITLYLNLATHNRIQVPVTPTAIYYLQISEVPGGSTTVAFTVAVGPNLATPIGTIAVPDDTSGFPLALLSVTDGSVLQFRPFPAGETGHVLPNGISLWQDLAGPNLVRLYDASLTLLASPAWATTGSNHPRISSNRVDRFYVGDAGGGAVDARVSTIADDGTLGPQVWTLPSGGLTTMAPSRDETTLYHNGQVSSIDSQIFRWNLLADVALTPLAAAVANYFVADGILVLADESIVVGYFKPTTTRDNFIRHYDAAGTVLHTYDVAGTDELHKLTHALDDPASFWIWILRKGANSGISQFQQIRVSDGAILTSVESPQYENGTYQPATQPPIAPYGHSFSCPFVVLPYALPPWGGGDEDEDQPPYVAPSYHLDARYIRRLRRAPHLAQENSRVFYRRFELDLERGVGLADGQGSDPMVLLRISRDGGQTWGEEQRMSAGKLGEYTARVIARRLGQARDTVFEVVVSDPVAWSLVGAWLDLEAGTS